MQQQPKAVTKGLTPSLLCPHCHLHYHTLTTTPCSACVLRNRSPAKPAAKPRATPSKGT